MRVLAAYLLLLPPLFAISSATTTNDKDEQQKLQCDTFLAPSKVGGWGVFAARDFVANEIVEIAPLSIPLSSHDPTLQTTILYDYAYAGTISYGGVMIYNHAPSKPNVRVQILMGTPPSDKGPGAISVTLVYTIRNIQAGEELFSSYNLEDKQNDQWFRRRGIELQETSIEATRIPSSQFQHYKDLFCSKALSGIGQTSFVDELHGDKLPLKFDFGRLPSANADWAIAKHSIQAEERIEFAPAAVLPLNVVGPLAPLVIQWNHLTGRHHVALRKLRNDGKLHVVRRFAASASGAHVRQDNFESFETTALLPFAGNVGLIQRVGSNNPNCRLQISGSGAGEGNASILLDIIAIRDIQPGETLRLNIQPAGTSDEKRTLRGILEHSRYLVPHYLEKDYEMEKNEPSSCKE